MNGQVQRLQKVDHGANYNDNDNDHSSSQLRVHKALTCPEGQSAWESQETIKGNCSTLTIEPYSKPRHPSLSVGKTASRRICDIMIYHLNHADEVLSVTKDHNDKPRRPHHRCTFLIGAHNTSTR